jgi:hypothetical protein
MNVCTGIYINKPQLLWLQTAIYHTGLDVKMEVTQWTYVQQKSIAEYWIAVYRDTQQ